MTYLFLYDKKYLNTTNGCDFLCGRLNVIFIVEDLGNKTFIDKYKTIFYKLY